MAPIVLNNFCPNYVSVGGLPTEIFGSIKMTHRVYIITKNLYI